MTCKGDQVTFRLILGVCRADQVLYRGVQLLSGAAIHLDGLAKYFVVDAKSLGEPQSNFSPLQTSWKPLHTTFAGLQSTWTSLLVTFPG